MERTNCPPGSGRYAWQTGDTLLGIATQNRTTVTALRSANPDINFEDIEAGTGICIPRSAPQCPSGRTYTVREGDTIASIAQRLGISAGELMERNPYVDPESLTQGQVLCVPEPRESPEPEQPIATPAPTPPTQPTPPTRPGPTPPTRPTPTPPTRPTPMPPTRPTPTPPTRPGPTPPTRPLPTPPTRPTPTPPTRPQPSPPIQLPQRPQPQPTPPEPTCPTGYTTGAVRFGQTLTDLLTQYNISYQSFRRANPSIATTRLVPGQRYCIPPIGQRSVCGTGLDYLIQPGEELTVIASGFGVTVERLLLLNQSLAPGDFVPGRVICIPS